MKQAVNAWRRALFVVLAIVLCATIVGACGGDDDEPAESAAAPAADATTEAAAPASDSVAAASEPPATSAESEPASSADAGTTSAANGEPHRLAFIVSGAGNTYIDTMERAAKETAEKLGVELDYKPGDWTTETNLSLLQDVAASGDYDGIIISVVDGNAMCEPVKEVAAKIPTAIVISQICGDSTYTEGTAFFSGRNDYEDGQKVAQMVADALGEAGGKVGYLDGPISQSNAVNLTNGFTDKLKEFPNLELVASVPADFDPAKALTASEDMLQAHPDIAAIAAGADNMAESAIKALENAGKDDVKVIGYAGTKGAFDAIRSGKMTGTVMALPYNETEAAVKAVVATLNGETLPSNVYLDGEDPMFEGKGNLITKDNVDKFEAQW
jgi:ribose transport system substrate-binding protein